MNGIINVFKEQNMTSHDCVAIVRRAIGIKRVGHTGTLDPMATGVLPICIGRAARIMDYTDLDKKEYEVELKFGIETDTLDIWGEVTKEENVAEIPEETVLEGIKKFQGEIQQIPPKYSALKVNGKKLYEYARENKEVEIKSRNVTVFKIELIDMNFPYLKLRVLCSKGTYIRSICRDLGQELGTVATMTSLKRTKSGLFDWQDGINIMDIKSMNKEELEEKLINTDYPLINFGKILLTEKATKDFLNGKQLSIDYFEIISDGIDNRYNVYGFDIWNLNEVETSSDESKDSDNGYKYNKEAFVGVGIIKNGHLKVDKVLY